MTQPKPRGFRMLSAALVEICDGDMTKGILLDALLFRQFDYSQTSDLDENGCFYRSMRKLVQDCKGWASRRSLIRRLKWLEKQPWIETHNPDDPNESRRYKIDIDSLGRALPRGYVVPHFNKAVHSEPESVTDDQMNGGSDEVVPNRTGLVPNRTPPCANPHQIESINNDTKNDI
ncbi:MAG: hypothetical protein U5L04_01480, partial [Trueperaceae bacterium]|nr:hypothetical protein [Trueperaceae bacterium]